MGCESNGSGSELLPTAKPGATGLNQQRGLSAGDLTGDELAEIACAEIPATERYRVKDLRPKPKR